MQETIFALATPNGKSGVAVVRFSGPKARDALKLLGMKNPPTPRKAIFTSLTFPESYMVLDQALIIYFSAPHSFTGEEIVELHLHGSRAVIKAVYEIFSSQRGFRLAEPGEFSKRAFENGKMDLTVAEGLADLIDSETIAQQKQAMRQMQGELGKLCESWRAEIIHAAAHLEAYIDFPDEDLPKDVEEKMLSSVKRLHAGIAEHLSDNRSGEILREGAYAVIIGAPNVGKSSLLNHLAKRDVAIVSDIAGTTRDVLEVKLDIAGYPVVLADTAGIRESPDNIEMEGVKRALERAERADLKIALFDSAAKEIDKKTLALIDENTVVLFSKSDEKPGTPDHPRLKDALPVSVKNNKGFDQFFSRLEKILAEKFTPSSDPKITRERHRAELTKAKNYLAEFLAGREKNIDIELSAEELRLAGRAIGRVTGRIDVEDILDELFRNFCIGK